MPFLQIYRKEVVKVALMALKYGRASRWFAGGKRWYLRLLYDPVTTLFKR